MCSHYFGAVVQSDDRNRWIDIRQLIILVCILNSVYP